MLIPKKDLVVISCLRQNARETLTKMSRRTRLPISTIYDRLKYREQDLILKHTSLLDFSKLGFNTRVTMAIKVTKDSRIPLDEFLKNHHSINSLYKINNGYDFLAEGIFRHLKDFQDFVERMEDKFPLVEKQFYYIVDDMKREAFLSNPDSVDSFLNMNENVKGQRGEI